MREYRSGFSNGDKMDEKEYLRNIAKKVEEKLLLEDLNKLFDIYNLTIRFDVRDNVPERYFEIKLSNISIKVKGNGELLINGKKYKENATPDDVIEVIRNLPEIEESLF